MIRVKQNMRVAVGLASSWRELRKVEAYRRLGFARGGKFANVQVQAQVQAEQQADDAMHSHGGVMHT